MKGAVAASLVTAVVMAFLARNLQGLGGWLTPVWRPLRLLLLQAVRLLACVYAHDYPVQGVSEHGWRRNDGSRYSGMDAPGRGAPPLAGGGVKSDELPR